MTEREEELLKLAGQMSVHERAVCLTAKVLGWSGWTDEQKEACRLLMRRQILDAVPELAGVGASEPAGCGGSRTMITKTDELLAAFKNSVDSLLRPVLAAAEDQSNEHAELFAAKDREIAELKERDDARAEIERLRTCLKEIESVSGDNAASVLTVIREMAQRGLTPHTASSFPPPDTAAEQTKEPVKP